VSEALRYTDMEGPLMTDSLRQALARAGFDYAPHTGHLEIVRRIRQALENSETAQVGDLLLRAALLRRFLG
jgi:phosphoenolpyruvate carboxylase